MLTPGNHRDTYVEEYHREFFTRYAMGKSPRKCAIQDEHIGGLAQVPALCFVLRHADLPELRAAVKEENFDAGILANAMVGGDNCHRGAVAGSLLGVANGVPAKWRDKAP